MIDITKCCLHRDGTCDISMINSTFKYKCNDNPNCCFRRKEHWKKKNVMKYCDYFNIGAITLLLAVTLPFWLPLVIFGAAIYGIVNLFNK
jgi:hypothetical protein